MRTFELKTCEVASFIESTGCVIPPVEEFWRLGDLTGLRQDSTGRFYRANYERGLLLYALVATHRPLTFLEFGTGRGYGALCVSWAMEDHNIPGRIYTIDMVPQDQPFDWAIDWGDGPRVERLSRSHVWAKAAPEALVERIVTITGRSSKVMERWSNPPVDMAFIDGGHDYHAVRHDFYSLLNVASTRFGVLFDDYTPDHGFGVPQLIDEEVSTNFDATLIHSDRRWPGGELSELEDPGYGMVWIDSETSRSPIDEAFPIDMRDRMRRQYRRRDRWASVRRFLGRTRRRIWLRS